MKEEQKILEYQETMKVDVENIAKTIREQYMKSLILHFLRQQNNPPEFLD